MRTFPPETRFCYSWRAYQERVLNELEEHLNDDHLHVVAPPGSGKTVLGLEVAVRLNAPVLILAPSIAIRNQWIQRFCELFLGKPHVPEWISSNIREPAFMTVATYQALYMACTGNEEEPEAEEPEEEPTSITSGRQVDPDLSRAVVDSLRTKGVRTIIVDEAHHLKNAWWRSLNAVKEGLNPTVVGLTATPPYDVSHAEWQRYLDLNGPVDAEISVPELVQEDDLCPHQDYLYLSSPTEEEYVSIRRHNQLMDELVDALMQDQDLVNSVKAHPCIAATADNLEWIYANFEWYVAMLVFLNATGVEVTRYQLKVVAGERIEVPDLTHACLEALLSFYLFVAPEDFANRGHQEKLLRLLKRHGAIEHRSIQLSADRKLSKLLTSSISKLNAIGKITAFEHRKLKADLRMVILTDYIRKEYLVSQAANDLPLNKIGVMPIFEFLRRHFAGGPLIGVLTGSLVIIPVAALDAFKQAACAKGVDDVDSKPLPHDDQYAMVNISGGIRHDIVHIFTKAFEAGAMQVIVGTKSLLGEGWDAPTINALVLASFVGSHVLSNQMRGRAIRKDPGRREKTSNIWHLVCVDYTDPEGGEDIHLLKRRFRSFVGLSCREHGGIENGFARLGYDRSLLSPEQVEAFNIATLERAARRDLLKEKWLEALATGSVLVEEIKLPFPDERGMRQLKRLYYRKTIRNFLISLGFSMLVFGQSAMESILRGLRDIRDPKDIIRILFIIGVLGVAYFGRRLLRAAVVLVKFRDISRDVRQIGKALLATLVEIGTIKTPLSRMQVCTEVDEFGAIYCHLKGASTYGKSVFVRALKEIVSKVENPRYVMIRKSRGFKFIPQRDFHAVPEMIGRNKGFAELFAAEWGRRVGRCELVYTRTIEGRKLLLKARVHSLAAQLEEEPEDVKVWR